MLTTLFLMIAPGTGPSRTGRADQTGRAGRCRKAWARPADRSAGQSPRQPIRGPDRPRARHCAQNTPKPGKQTRAGHTPFPAEYERPAAGRIKQPGSAQINHSGAAVTPKGEDPSTRIAAGIRALRRNSHVTERVRERADQRASWSGASPGSTRTCPDNRPQPRAGSARGRPAYVIEVLITRHPWLTSGLWRHRPQRERHRAHRAHGGHRTP